MTREEAHRILDAAKAGLPVSSEQITQALLVTGDLAPQWRQIGPRVERLQ